MNNKQLIIKKKLELNKMHFDWIFYVSVILLFNVDELTLLFAEAEWISMV